MRRFRRSRKVFVRNFSTSFTQTGIAPGSPGVADIILCSFDGLLGTGSGAAKSAKSIIIQGIDWRSDGTFLNAPGNSATADWYSVSECLYRNEALSSGGAGVHTGIKFLESNEFAAANEVMGWPARILFRRRMLPALTIGQPFGTNYNWHPLRVRTKCRLQGDDTLFWHVEMRNPSGNTGNLNVFMHCLAAVAYSVVT